MATLQAAALGAILLASTFAVAALLAPASNRIEFMFATILAALVFGFFAGGLGIGLALMVVGAPVARLAGNRLNGRSGTVVAVATAIASVIGLYAINAERPFALMVDTMYLFIAMYFAVPAAVYYRCQVLLERTFDRP